MYKKHFCAVWREAEKSKNLVGRIRVSFVRGLAALANLFMNFL